MKKRISKQENQAENSVFDKIKLKLTDLFKPKEKAPEAEKAAEADSKDSNADGAAGSQKDGKKGGISIGLIKKLSYFLVALIISMTLWGYVLLIENPMRIIRLDNIPVTFEAGSESDLYARNLTLLGDASEVLPTISVNVRTTLNDLPRFKNGRISDIIKATVSLNSVHSSGSYELPISVTTTIGEIDSLPTDSAVISVDNLVERTIPIHAELVGELPEGYWHGDPVLLTNSVVVRGAESEISRIAKALCLIDLSGKTDAINASYTLGLYDNADESIPISVIVGVLPSVTVNLEILPTLEYKVEANIVGENNLKTIYEICDVTVTPSTITLVGEAELLSQIDENKLSLDVIDVTGIDGECVITRSVQLNGIPNDVFILGGDTKFTVSIEIREKIIEKSFVNVPVNILNEDLQHYRYSYMPSNDSNIPTCTVTIKGKASLVNSITYDDLRPVFSVSGLSVGLHENLIPKLSLISSYNLEINVTPISCRITEPSPKPKPPLSSN